MSSNEKKDPIATALGLMPLQNTSDVIIAPPVVETENTDFAKSQIKSAITDGQQALGDLLGIAQSSQHPRAYEVVATLLTAITNSSEKLASLEMKQQAHIKKSQQPTNSNSPGTVNNNLFVGNATELLRVLKEAQKNNEGK